MGYIGLRTDNSGFYRTLDDISGSFNGSTTTFALTFNSGAPLEVTDPRQLLVSIDGVIQEPETSFGVSGTNITFSEAPGGGSIFWGILLGGTYNVLAREIQNAILLNGKYDSTFGPQNSGAILTANTPSYTDNSTKVATTNFIRQRTIPWFEYIDNTPPTLTYDASTTLPFADGNLFDSDVVTGLSMTSGELTIPAAWYGLWRFEVHYQSSAANNQPNAAHYFYNVKIEQWDGAAWQQGLPGHIDGRYGWLGTSTRNSRLLKIDATNNKIRVQIFQSNDSSFNITSLAASLRGIYLGGNT